VDNEDRKQASVGVQSATYVAIVFLLSTPFWIAFAHGRAMSVPVVMLLMWCPATAAIACTLIFRRKFSRLGLDWGGWDNAALGYFLPIIYGLIAYAIIWGAGIGHVPNYVLFQALALKLHMVNPSTTKLMVMMLLGFGVVWELTGGVIAGGGEELGWRGFLAPTLAARYGWKAASVITGVIWAVWHWPVIIWSTYHSTAPTLYTLVCFTWLTVSLSFLFSWVRLRSRSVWPCALMHASHNVWVQAIFTGITVTTARSKWWIDNYGAMVPLVVTVFVLVMLVKGGLNPEAETAAETTSQ
jgi:membrane protease YdiL (CAAX protease family)